MVGTHHRRLWVFLAAAHIASAAWFWLPGSAMDRLAFSTVATSFAHPPLVISGAGSHAAPWSLRTMDACATPNTRQVPVIVSLGDDHEGVFQSAPPSPIDFAVILRNFQRLGVKKGGTAVVMAWDAPDPIGLAAMDKTIERFDSWVMAAPLSRGAVPEPIPAAFRMASVPIDSVCGDVLSLPVVNRIPLPGIILGGENSLAGFQGLDSEPAGKLMPLVARWDDRVVFAFPVIAALQRLDLPVAGVEIRLGETLKLSRNGPIVALDRYGRLAVPLTSLTSNAQISAASLIDGGEELLPKHELQSVILRDDRSAADPATRSFSNQLSACIAALTTDTGFTAAIAYHRLPAHVEWLVLLLLALGLTALTTLPAFHRTIGWLTMASGFLFAQCVAAVTTALWLPGLLAIVTIASAFVISFILAHIPVVPALRLHPTPTRISLLDQVMPPVPAPPLTSARISVVNQAMPPVPAHPSQKRL